MTPLPLPRATDISANARALRVESLALAVEVRWAPHAGICVTLEGDMPYDAGDAIVTGVAGESWPVRANLFMEIYQACAPTAAGQDGKYRKRVSACVALRLESAVQVEMNARGDVLKGNAGDWLLQYEPSRHGIVRNDIFERTYRILGFVDTPSATGARCKALHPDRPREFKAHG